MNTKKILFALLLLCLAGKSMAQAPISPDSLIGTIFIDTDGDCEQDAFEETLSNWEVIATVEDSLFGGLQTYSGFTDANGQYQIDLPGGPNYLVWQNGAMVQLVPPAGFGQYCISRCSTYTQVQTPGNNYNGYLSYALQCDTTPPCPVLDVSINTNFLRPCFESKYRISYRNYTSLFIPDASIQVTIDNPIQVLGASIPYTTNGNVYTFDLGTVSPFAWGNFSITVFTPCDEPVGTTYCAEAHAFPDTCQSLAGPNWDGSRIEVSAACETDQVIFTLKNTGTGNMAAPLEYIVVEDNVLLMQSPGQFQLNAGASQEVFFPADGSFYRMEADQSPGFPGFGTPIAWAEGCGTGGNPSLGFVNQFQLGDEDPWLDIFCIESVNSFDPNDKQGFPRGVGEKHYIEQNVDLEYMIRFQNTGTAPAVNVVIRDTLPTQFLDPTTLRRGVSSHPYLFDMEGNGVVVFKFLNINLPDSNANEAASHGFVTFRISQHQDLPLESAIKNAAAIYFDFNEPIITNQTLHTIGKDFLQLSNTQTLFDARLKVQIMPNPAQGHVLVLAEGLENKEQDLSFRLISVLGEQAQQGQFRGNVYEFNAAHLPPGVYVYEIRNGGKLAATGKLLKL